MSDKSPKVFFSYAWTNEAHSQAVMDLATRVRSDGVDVVIDRWDLRPGDDAHHFMERMVSNPEMAKVIIISNKTYVEKANSRTGGAGTEAQILTKELYSSVSESKFALVAFESDDQGNPYVPNFYGSRIYINFSEQRLYEEQYEQLIRFIHNSPLHKKPPVGKKPSFLSDHSVPIKNVSAYKRLIQSLRSGRESEAEFREYVDSLKDSLEDFRIQSVDGSNLDDSVVKSIEELKPLAIQIIELTRELARNGHRDQHISHVTRILEVLLEFTGPPQFTLGWYSHQFDNLKFFAHESFLLIFAVLIKEEKFSIAKKLLTSRYLKPKFRSGEHSTLDFTAFYNHLESLEYRNKQLKLNKWSLHADILKERYVSGPITFDELIQSDALICLYEANRVIKNRGNYASWFPITLVYCDRYSPLHVFAKSESRHYADQVANLLDVESVEALKELPSKIEAAKLDVSLGFRRLPIGGLLNCARLGLYP